MDNKNNFDNIIRRFPGRDRDKLKEIYEISKIHLSSIQRRTGENYSVHGLEVALTFLESNNNTSLAAIALLHDILVHPNGEQLLLQTPLTPKEQNLVKTMNKLRRLHVDTNTQDLDKFVDATSEENNLIPLRMAHRLNDVRHLHRFTPELQQKIAHESLHMYASIAGRLGMHKWKYEMEDICFKRLHNKTATDLQKKFKEFEKLDHTCLHQTFQFLERKFCEANIPVRIETRLKSLYSTYRKMLIKKRQFEELTDRIALRIITKNLEDCYRVLGIIHLHMHPIAGKLKDYIGAPKENGYQSIHSVVYTLPGVTEQPIEIQIRTENMHQVCEYGISAHGEYKNFNYSLKTGHAHVDFLKNFQMLGVKGRSPSQFEETLRKYFDENQIAIFDSDNNLYHIKRPASILDFLCVLHPKKLANLREVRLNGRIASIDVELHDGDTVEAKFRSHRSIKHSWINACKNEKNAKRIQEIINAKS